MFSNTIKQRDDSPKKHRGTSGASNQGGINKPGGDNSMDQSDFIGSPSRGSLNVGSAQKNSSPTRGGITSSDGHISKN